jgi:hypothetical protein
MAQVYAVFSHGRLPSLVTSALKMESACFAERSASTYETTRAKNQNNTNITLNMAMAFPALDL